MGKLCQFSRRSLLVASLLWTLAARTSAQSFILDDFDAPAAAQTLAAFGQPDSATAKAQMRTVAPSIAGGVREVLLSYGDGGPGTAHVTAGAGAMRMEQPNGTTGYASLTYGAFTRPSEEAPLVLDLRTRDALSLTFARMEGPLAIGATFYTSEPLTPSDPLYYASSQLNVQPLQCGAAVTVLLPFEQNPRFNWSHVEGVVVWIYSPVTGAATTVYVLDQLAFHERQISG